MGLMAGCESRLSPCVLKMELFFLFSLGEQTLAETVSQQPKLQLQYKTVSPIISNKSCLHSTYLPIVLEAVLL